VREDGRVRVWTFDSAGGVCEEEHVERTMTSCRGFFFFFFGARVVSGFRRTELWFFERIGGLGGVRVDVSTTQCRAVVYASDHAAHPDFLMMNLPIEAGPERMKM
jgi:hypothetical protein